MATAFVAIAGAVAVVLVKRTQDPDYWLSGAALLVPLVLAVAGRTLRPVNSRTTDELGEDARQLQESVFQQWKEEVDLRISIYPLPVPFSAATEVTGPVAVPVSGGKPGEWEAREVTVPVMDSWVSILRDPDRQPPSMDGTYNSIPEVFGADGLPNRLVVLGEPGSGKSILAQSLTFRLIDGGQASGNGTRAASLSGVVPVLLPLATWDPNVPLRDWAAAQIARTYPWLATETQVRGGASRTLAGRLLDQGKLLMILDGLDEVAQENRLTAFRKLSEAARKDQAMVVTCRTREYAQIVHDSRHPMPRTPVIRLLPLPLADVRTFLAKAGEGSGSRVGQLVDQVSAAPRGPLAEALQSPLALWLVTTVYQDFDKDPAELGQYQSRGQILKHLLDGLVTAAYSAPAGDDYPALEDPAAVELARRRLTKIAIYLGPDLQSQNIDWWRLPEQVPHWFIGGLIGTLVGCVLGAAVGLAATARFGDRAGVLLGIIFGIITGVLSGVTSVRPQEHPRTVDLHFRWNYWRFVGCLTVGVVVGLTSGYADVHHGGLVAGLITAAVVGPACAVPCIRAFGMAPGVTAGVTAAVAFGLSSGLSAGNGQPALSGLLAGLVFAVAAWVFVGLFQPAQDKYVVTPHLLLDRDRVGSLTVAGTAGVAFGVVYGIALGPFFGVVALIALTVTVAVSVSVWAAFNVSRVWLSMTGMVPLEIMAFLAEAYARGVLRQVGGSYQFRHTELKEALLPDPAAVPPGPGAVPPGPSTLQGAAANQSAP